jgi:hypothetical protein
MDLHRTAWSLCRISAGNSSGAKHEGRAAIASAATRSLPHVDTGRLHKFYPERLLFEATTARLAPQGIVTCPMSGRFCENPHLQFEKSWLSASESPAPAIHFRPNLHLYM